MLFVLYIFCSAHLAPAQTRFEVQTWQEMIEKHAHICTHKFTKKCIATSIKQIYMCNRVAVLEQIFVWRETFNDLSLVGNTNKTMTRMPAGYIKFDFKPGVDFKHGLVQPLNHIGFNITLLIFDVGRSQINCHGNIMSMHNLTFCGRIPMSDVFISTIAIDISIQNSASNSTVYLMFQPLNQDQGYERDAKYQALNSSNQLQTFELSDMKVTYHGNARYLMGLRTIIHGISFKLGCVTVYDGPFINT